MPQQAADPAIRQAVLAGIGLDRTGIIDEVSQFLLDQGIDIVETQLCNLRGSASFLLVINGQSDAIAQLRGSLTELGASARMTVELLPAKAVEETAPMVGEPYRLISRSLDQAGLGQEGHDQAGHDHSGVVNRLSHLLRVLNVNIENFKIDPPSDGSIGFDLNLLLSVPRQTPVTMLRGYLEQLCGEIGISCDLQRVASQEVASCV